MGEVKKEREEGGREGGRKGWDVNVKHEKETMVACSSLSLSSRGGRREGGREEGRVERKGRSDGWFNEGVEVKIRNITKKERERERSAKYLLFCSLLFGKETRGASRELFTCR